MTMRAGRRDRRAVIGHPVIRKKPSDDDATIVASGIRRRQDPKTPGPPSAGGSPGPDNT